MSELGLYHGAETLGNSCHKMHFCRGHHDVEDGLEKGIRNAGRFLSPLQTH